MCLCYILYQEVMFLIAFICLFICVCNNSKAHLMDISKVFYVGRASSKEEVIKFRSYSGQKKIPNFQRYHFEYIFYHFGFYRTAHKGCLGIVFTHGVWMGERAGRWLGGGGKKFARAVSQKLLQLPIVTDGISSSEPPILPHISIH